MDAETFQPLDADSCQVPDGADTPAVLARLQQELAMLNERLGLAQRSAGAGLWDWDIRRHKLYWSPELFALFGLDPAVWPADRLTWKAIVHPDDRPVVNAAIEAARSGREPLSCEFRIHPHGDGAHWIQLFGDTQYDKDGVATRMAGICLDITARKQMEAALRESEDRFRSVLDNSSQAAYRRDLLADRYDYLSPVIESITGWSIADMTTMSTATVVELIHPDDVAEVRQALERMEMNCQASGRASLQLEYRLRDPGGEYRWIGDTVTILADPMGRAVYRQGLIRDIRERKRSERLLLARMHLTEFGQAHTLDEFLQATLAEAEDLTDSRIGFYHFLEADQETLTLQMWSENTLAHMCTAVGKGTHYSISRAGVWVECVRERRPVIHNDYESLPAHRRRGLPSGHAPVIRELVVPVIRDDRIVAILGVGNKPRDYDEADVALVSELADLAWERVGRKRAEEALAAVSAQIEFERNRLSAVMEALPIGVAVVGPDAELLQSNRAFQMIWGRAAPVDTDNRYDLYQAWWTHSERGVTPEEWASNRAIQRGETVLEQELRIQRFDGQIAHVLNSAVPIRDERGQVQGCAVAMMDITSRVRAEDELRSMNAQLEGRLQEIQVLQEQLREQAIRDPLTGLYNRRYMQETFEVALAHAKRLGESIGVLLMDVDHFKSLNDRFGHKAGDLMLEALGRLLRATSRQMDIACRYGGEEFVLVMPGATLAMALQRAESWRAAFAAQRLDDSGATLQATLSVGVAGFPDHGHSVDDLLRAADTALYLAKRAGRNCVKAPGSEHPTLSGA